VTMKPRPSIPAMMRSRLCRFVRWLSPAARRRIAAWERGEGITFLKALGIGQGGAVLDFGSGLGHYSVPAARVVGNAGIVCAIERNALRRWWLALRASMLDLPMLHVHAHLGDVQAKMPGQRFSAVLLFAVLHLLDATERHTLYAALRSLLADGGTVYVYPVHMRNNQPSRHFQEMDIGDVIREIENAGFKLRVRKDCPVWHDFNVIPGVVLVFGLDAGDHGV